MNTPSTAAPRTTETLKAAIAGQVFVRGEAGYDQARQAWNLAMDQRPAVVVEAAITQAGTDQNVAALVYIAAFAPDKDESVDTL
jgi:hypothetical protein